MKTPPVAAVTPVPAMAPARTTTAGDTHAASGGRLVEGGRPEASDVTTDPRDAGSQGTAPAATTTAS